jgi:SAM-dependent methyltransferase
MNRGSLKRRLLRRTPYLSRLARTLDTLEEENRALQKRLSPLLLTGSAAPDAATPAVDADGLPLPPATLRHWVAGTDDLASFLEYGQLGVQTLVTLLARHDVALEHAGSILDFGCGCGRVLRHLRRFDRLRIHGTDSNPAAIAWCDQHLDFAEFGTNRLEPPTRYRPNSFDCIYAFSVFTHLPEALQLAWMRELRRILKPGGHLIITVHGDHYLPHIAVASRAQYQRGELVVLGEEAVGQNHCAAFHPQPYVRNVLAREFEVLDFIPEGALGNPKQDVYLLKG